MDKLQTNQNLTSMYQSNHSRFANYVAPKTSTTTDTKQIDQKETAPKYPGKLLIFSTLGIFVALLSPRFIVKNFMKSDDKLKIKADDVKDVLNHIFKENKLDEKGVTQEIVDGASEKGKEILGQYGGAVYRYTKNNSVNQIEATKDTFSLILHEAGHAINRNCSKLGKIYSNTIATIVKATPNAISKVLQFSNPLNIALWATFIFQMIGNHYNNSKIRGKNPDEKDFSLSKFVHKNIGTITMLCFAPILADEGMASYRAIKAAKKASPQMLKPLGKNLLVAGSTYVITTVAAMVSSLASKKVGDQSYAYVKYQQAHKSNIAQSTS